MAQITSSVGLSTGIDITGTVDSLMEVASQQRDALSERNETLQAEQLAVTELTSLLYSIKSSVSQLGDDELYGQKTATSSNSSALSVSVTDDASEGTYQFTPLQTAQSQQLLSSGFNATDEPIGTGTLRFRYGGNVEQGTEFDMLGGGAGLQRGTIRITDRSGAQADIDLSTAITVDDVLEAINENTTIDVTAVALGDGFRLLDNTGETTSNLKVEEVGDGSTAASLGLAGIDVNADSADGDDMLWLYEDLDLDQLNDGTGVRIDTVLDDIEYTLRDGTTGTIDLSPIISGSSAIDEDLTLGDVLDRINAAAPDKLQISIDEDGDRLVITDLTTGTGDFALTSVGSYDVLADLGLDGEAVDGEITGRRILGGTQTVLLSSLGGGDGLGELGSVQLTDRSGTSATVDLSAAETLQDLIDALNNAGIGISASVNAAKTGITLTDTTGDTASNLVVASADATNTAETLGIAVDDAVTEIDGGDLHLQVIGMNTSLSDYNGGAGVAQGTFVIRDSSYGQTTITLGSSIETVGDLITQINRQADTVRAELNETGDGIRIVDLGDGSTDLVIEEGSSTTAADLHLLGDVVEVEIEGETYQVIDGSTTYEIELDEDSTLEDLYETINGLDAGLGASILTAGSSNPYHLTISSQQTGLQGRLVFDTSQIDFTLTETTQARDAVLVYGDLDSPSSTLLMTSSTDTFSDAVSGMSLTIGQASETPITVTVGASNSGVVSTLSSMVVSYNSFRQRLSELTEYNAATETAAVLTGDTTALRLDMDLPNLLSGAFSGAGDIGSLAELGIDIEDDGTLTLDEDQLTSLFASNPDAIEEFFITEDYGFADRFDQLIEQLAGEDSSLLSARIDALAETIEQNEDRIARMDEQLASERQRLLIDFYNMEIVVGKLQNSLEILESMYIVEPMATSGD